MNEKVVPIPLIEKEENDTVSLDLLQQQVVTVATLRAALELQEQQLEAMRTYFDRLS